MDDYTASSNQHDSSSNSASTIHAARASTASASDLSAGTSDGLCATSLSGATACKKGPRSRSVVTPLACTECRKKRAKVRLHGYHSIQADLASITSSIANYLDHLN